MSKNKRIQPDQIETLRPEQIETRSATGNAALGISAASPFLYVGAQALKEKLTNRPKDDAPKIELPPGVDKDH